MMSLVSSLNVTLKVLFGKTSVNTTDELQFYDCFSSFLREHVETKEGQTCAPYNASARRNCNLHRRAKCAQLLCLANPSCGYDLN